MNSKNMNKEKQLTILLSPRLSEKSAGKYIFQVAKSANKFDIKAAVENLFQVTVKSVNVLNMKSATAKKVGRAAGRQLSWKKAYVVLNEGQQINVV